MVEEKIEKNENVKLRGKKKKGKGKEIANIPDLIDIEKEDQNIEQIREDNKEPEIKDRQRGKCGCFIF